MENQYPSNIDYRHYADLHNEFVGDYPVLEIRPYIMKTEDHYYVLLPSNILVEYRYKVVDRDIYLSEGTFLLFSIGAAAAMLVYLKSRYDNIHLSLEGRARRVNNMVFAMMGMIVNTSKYTITKDMNFDRLLELIEETPMELGGMDLSPAFGFAQSLPDFGNYTFNNHNLVIKKYSDGGDSDEINWYFFDNTDLAATIFGMKKDFGFVIDYIWQSPKYKGLVRDLYKNFLLDKYGTVISDNGLSPKGIQMWRKFLEDPDLTVGVKMLDGATQEIDNIQQMNSYMFGEKEDSRFFIRRNKY